MLNKKMGLSLNDSLAELETPSVMADSAEADVERIKNVCHLSQPLATEDQHWNHLREVTL